jgi:hypothetical protein
MDWVEIDHCRSQSGGVALLNNRQTAFAARSSAAAKTQGPNSGQNILLTMRRSLAGKEKKA